VAVRDISGNMYWAQRTHCMAGSNSDGNFLLRVHLKEHIYALPPGNVEGLLARLQAVLTMGSARALWRVRRNAVRGPGVCLELDVGRFEHPP
jgi:hypothetical protein